MYVCMHRREARWCRGAHWCRGSGRRCHGRGCGGGRGRRCHWRGCRGARWCRAVLREWWRRASCLLCVAPMSRPNRVRAVGYLHWTSRPDRLVAPSVEGCTDRVPPCPSVWTVVDRPVVEIRVCKCVLLEPLHAMTCDGVLMRPHSLVAGAFALVSLLTR